VCVCVCVRAFVLVCVFVPVSGLQVLLCFASPFVQFMHLVSHSGACVSNDCKCVSFWSLTSSLPPLQQHHLLANSLHTDNIVRPQHLELRTQDFEPLAHLLLKDENRLHQPCVVTEWKSRARPGWSEKEKEKEKER
jgi:hypothetical protein